MKQETSIIELIKARSSRRKYAAREIPGKLKQDILDHTAAPLEGPFGNPVRFRLVEKEISEKEEKVRLGTYGFISGAKYFIVGALKEGEKNFEDYGYLMERLILYLTGLGLGTCWLGGSFKRGEFAKVFDLAEDEIIPAVTPVGYASQRRGVKESLMRMAVKADNRKPWQELFFKDNFSTPLDREQAGKYEIPLQMLRLAPSASNKQPWRILLSDNAYHFFLKRTKNYDKMIKAADMQRLDMGIAMCHFELTARESGLPGQWRQSATAADKARQTIPAKSQNLRKETRFPPDNSINDLDIDIDDRMEYIVSWLASGGATTWPGDKAGGLFQ